MPIAKRAIDVMTQTNKLKWWMILTTSLRAKACVPKTLVKQQLRLHSLYFPQNIAFLSSKGLANSGTSKTMKLLLLISAVWLGSVVEGKFVLVDDDRCTACKAAVTDIETVLGGALPTVINASMKACDKESPSVAPMCKKIVSGLPTVVKAILANLQPGPTCMMAKYCSSFLKEVEVDKAGGTAVSWGPVECNFCKFLFQFIQQNLMSEQMENGLLLDIAKVCKLLNPKMGQQCTDILATYGDLILNYIKSLISPDHICPMINVQQHFRSGLS